MHRDQFNRTCVPTQAGNNKISEKVKEDFLRVMKLNLGFEGRMEDFLGLKNKEIKRRQKQEYG